MTTRRDMLKSGAGLAAILASGKAPAYLVKSMVAARNSIGMKSGGAKLPYDAEVEYISNISGSYNTNGGATGGSNLGSFIDTGIYPVGNSSFVEIGISFPADYNQNAYQCVFGGYDSNQRNYGIVTRGKTIIMLNGNQASSTDSPVLYNEFVFDSGSNTIRVNGTDTSFATTGFSGNSNAPIYLFTNSAVGSLSQYEKAYTFIGSVHYFRYLIDGILCADLIPVRFTNEQGVSEGAMYDKVSKQLFRNQGTGAFVTGPDASAGNGGGV